MIVLHAPLQISLNALDLLMNFRLGQYPFIKNMLKTHYCPMQAFISQVPIMICAIAGSGVIACLLGCCVMITRCCPQVHAFIMDTYESFVWSGIIRIVLQSFLILCFSMATDFSGMAQSTSDE